MVHLDLLMKNGVVVDPAHNLEKRLDVGIKDGKIATLEEEISRSKARVVINLKEKTIIPRAIDSHVHIGNSGHRNMVKVCVVTAVDFTAPMEQVMQRMKESGTGMNIAAVTAIGTYIRRNRRGGSFEECWGMFSQPEPWV